MSDFKREERYIVIKRKYLDEAAEAALRGVIHGLDLPTEECVVVESDWPNYEATWKTVQRVADGTYDPDELTRLQSEVDRLRGRVAMLTDYVKEEVADGHTYKDYQNILDTDQSMPWLLRKQAESAEQAAKELSTIPGAALWDCEEVQDWLERAYAQRLRQQAAESEGGDDDKP